MFEHNKYFLEAKDANTLGERPIDVPVMIGHVVDDPTIPIEMTNTLVEKLEYLEQPKDLTYCKYQGNGDPESIANHNEILNIMFSNTPTVEGNCRDAATFLIEHGLRISDED